MQLRSTGSRRVPHWAKLAAIPVVLAVIAGLNLHAAAADRRKAREVAARIDASIVQVGGVADLGEFSLGVVVTNNGPQALRVRDLRVTPSTYPLTGTSHGETIASDSSMQAGVVLAARCPVPSGLPTLRIAVPLVAASGRTQEVSVAVDGSLIRDLAHQACGEITGFDAGRVDVHGVSSTQYGVSFVMTVDNSSFNSFSLVDVSSPGLSFAIRDGTPVRVPAHGQVLFHVTAQLPSCALLPPDGRAGTLRYGTLQLDIVDQGDVRKALPYTPDPGGALYPALVALRTRICPGAATLPSGVRRPRGLG